MLPEETHGALPHPTRLTNLRDPLAVTAIFECERKFGYHKDMTYERITANPARMGGGWRQSVTPA